MNWSSWQPVLLWLLSFSCSAISEENHAHESVKNHTGEKTDLEKQVDSCPADCVCNLDGTVDCGGVDLKEFPKNLSQSILHLSLQVRNSINLCAVPLQEYLWVCLPIILISKRCFVELLFVAIVLCLPDLELLYFCT